MCFYDATWLSSAGDQREAEVVDSAKLSPLFVTTTDSGPTCVLATVIDLVF